ncbi:PAS domain S-box protein [Bryobacter aggregatus]|uniref:PAS domain S-box protein n=1 Tax=Bryobacter aggregatus TaxID=360054 RepID=UPI0004E0CCD8|nr:PAS domain S-box protein [Bryobacter aggregatus]
MAAVLVTTIGASYFASASLRHNESRRAEKLLASASETLQDRVQTELDGESTAVQRLASKWQIRPDMPRQEWDFDAKQILEDHPSLLALGWIENQNANNENMQPDEMVRDWKISWALPRVYEPAVIKLHGLVEQNRLALLGEVVKDRRMKITEPIYVADRGKVFAAYAPSLVDGKIKGAVVGVFHMQVLMDSIFDRILANDYSIQLLDGYQVIYSRGEAKNHAADLEHDGNMKIFGAAWQMRLWPNPEIRRANESMAWQILYGGGVLSFFLAGLVWFVARRGEVSAISVIPEKRGETGDVRRKIEDRLRIWEAAIANVDDAIFVAESEKVIGTGTPILFANEAFTQLTGFQAGEVIGKTPKMLLQDAGASHVGATLHEAMLKNQPVASKFPLSPKQGSPVEVEMRVKPVQDPQNRTTHCIVLLKKVERAQEAVTVTETAPQMHTAALLASLLAETPLPVQVLDGAGAVLGWNRLAAEVTGWSHEEVLGQLTPIPVTVPQAGFWHRQDLKATRKDGTRLDLSVWTAPLRDPAQESAPVTCWMSFMADVTSEHLAQEELALRESRFRALVENASDILAVLDLDSTLQYINPAVQQVLGYESTELLGAKALELIQASDVPAAQKSLEEASRGLGPSRPRTLHVRHQDGSLREIESVISLIKGSSLAVMSARDVTGRSRSDVPEVSPAWFLNAVQDAIITYDTESRVIWMNRAAEDLYNLSSAFAQGKTLGELLPDWLQVPSRDQIREALDTEGFWKGEVSNFTPSGREVVQDVSVTATYDAEQRRIGAVAIHRDITEKKSAMDALQVDEKTKTLNALGNSDGLWDWNLRTDEVYFSPRWKQMLGYADEEIAGDLGEWYLMVHPDDLTLLKNKVAMHLKGQTEHLEAEYRIRTKDGQYRWMMTRAMAMRNAEGEATRLVGLQMDVHEQKEMDEQLLFEAFHDSITGLANRALFLDRVNGALARNGAAQPFSIAFVDLEHFAQVNETLGTRGGDKALAEAGRRIVESLPKDSFVARHGSDEFVALVHNADQKKLQDLSELLRYQLAKPFEYQGKTVSFKLNAGFATSQSRSYSNGEEMLQDASRAMAASRTGKTASPIFTPELSAPAEAPAALEGSSNLEAEMRHGIENGEFRVFYHPIITLDTGEIAGVEALIRWQHPERGLMTPGEFLHVAEASGLILDLDRWMMQEAVAKAAELNHRVRRAEPLVLTVNLSSLHFAEEDFTVQLEAILLDSDVNPRYLRIELSERVALQGADSEVMLRNLGRLRVQLNVDDYHNNADGLAQFARLPIDRVKLDSSLVRGLATGRNLEKVRAIIGAAQSQNMQVVAEGVETLEQLAVLRELKCHLAQGFYFTKPASAHDTERLLARSPRW